MGHIIHARRTPDGLRYRVWSTVVDAYLSEPMTETEAREWDLGERLDDARNKHLREIDNRLLRANTCGTSELIAIGNTLDAPWKTERCRCGCFHHEFERGSLGQCVECGQYRSDRSHEPPCKPPHNDPPNEGGDPMDVPIDHDPEDE